MVVNTKTIGKAFKMVRYIKNTISWVFEENQESETPCHNSLIDDYFKVDTFAQYQLKRAMKNLIKNVVDDDVLNMQLTYVGFSESFKPGV